MEQVRTIGTLQPTSVFVLQDIDVQKLQAANCLDIASQELHSSGEPDAQTLAAKIETCVEEADRNLSDVYHVMNLLRLQYSSAFPIFFHRFLQPPLPKRFASSAHFFLQRAVRTTDSR